VQQIAAYSITSSAMASTPGGMVKPSALAVLRLTISSLMERGSSNSDQDSTVKIFLLPGRLFGTESKVGWSTGAGL
jgi:hypothetical protein